MSARHVLALVVLALPALSLSASPAGASVRFAPAEAAKLAVEGTSTVRPFKCDARAVKLNARGSGESVAGAIPDLAAGTLEIATADLDCANNTMNDHLRTALVAKEHPTIRFSLTKQEAGAASGDGVSMKLHGKLTLSGQTHPVVVEGVATAAGEGTLRFQGSHRLNMTEWGVKPPRLMLGTLKVGDEVTISYDVVLAKQ